MNQDLAKKKTIPCPPKLYAKAGSARKRTVGQEALDVFRKGTYEPSPVALQQEMTKTYYQNMIDRISEDRKLYKGNFFLVVLTKREQLLTNVLRNFFFTRRTCPTPDYDQSVFRFNHLTEDIEYIWTIPSQDACQHLLDHMDRVHADEHELLGYVIRFKRGELYRLAKKFNREYDKPGCALDPAKVNQ